MARWRSLVVIVLGLLLGAAPAVVTPVNAAPLAGYDISWPQCPTSVGGNGLPLPPASAQFVVIGLTRGLPFTQNPCLASQVDWARGNAVPAHAYTIPAFPTAAQLSEYGRQGPWSADTRSGQLSNVGYAQARYALTSLDAVGFSPPVVWIDVEPRRAQPWPTAAAAQQRENRYVVEGLMRGLRDAGTAYGIYSYQSAWQSITGSWQQPGVPVWSPAGHLDYPTEAEDRCIQPSFSGGPVHLAQWTDDVFDYDITCGSYTFTPLPIPPSSLSNSTQDWDGDWNNDVLARNPVNGSLLLYRGTGRGTFVQGATAIGTGWTVFDALDTVGDWDGDGALDVLARRGGDLWLYPGDGRGGWRPGGVVGGGFQIMSTLTAPGDFSGDGHPDLLAVERDTGKLWLYPGNGRGGFQARVQVGAGWSVMRVASSPGDFDGDGCPDLLAVENATGRLWLYPGTCTGGWRARVLVGSGWNVMNSLVGIGDSNGDRTADVLAREASTGILWLYPGDGRGGWQARVSTDAGWNGLDPLF
jgi:FG-GAP-like repeat